MYAPPVFAAVKKKDDGTLEYGSVATLFSDEPMTRKAHSTISRQFKYYCTTTGGCS